MIAKPWETGLALYADEAALLRGLHRRERLACTCLLKQYAPRLYRLALQITGDPDEAEDVLQESFINACSHVDKFEGRSRLGTWLHQIVLNTALGHLRKQARERVIHLSEPADFPLAVLAQPAPDPGVQAITIELQETIERALLTLPDTLRLAFVLRDIEGLSTSEAAATLGITESALKVRLHRAHQALRPVLRPYLQLEPAEEPA